MAKFTKTLGLEEALKLVVVSSTVTYIGLALPGSAISAAVWKVKRLTSTSSGDLDIEWADSGRYTQVWADRVSLLYT